MTAFTQGITANIIEQSKIAIVAMVFFLIGHAPVSYRTFITHFYSFYSDDLLSDFFTKNEKINNPRRTIPTDKRTTWQI